MCIHNSNLNNCAVCIGKLLLDQIEARLDKQDNLNKEIIESLWKMMEVTEQNKDLSKRLDEMQSKATAPTTECNNEQNIAGHAGHSHDANCGKALSPGMVARCITCGKESAEPFINCDHVATAPEKIGCRVGKSMPNDDFIKSKMTTEHVKLCRCESCVEKLYESVGLFGQTANSDVDLSAAISAAISVLQGRMQETLAIIKRDKELPSSPHYTKIFLTRRAEVEYLELAIEILTKAQRGSK
jgi:hypothetical protein